MDRKNTKAKITNYFSKTTAKNGKSLDHVPETSETPGASEPSSVYMNPKSACLQENNTEQTIEQQISQEDEERQSIPNKLNQPRNTIFPVATFWKRKTCFQSEMV